MTSSTNLLFPCDQSPLWGDWFKMMDSLDFWRRQYIRDMPIKFDPPALVIFDRLILLLEKTSIETIEAELYS